MSLFVYITCNLLVVSDFQSLFWPVSMMHHLTSTTTVLAANSRNQLSSTLVLTMISVDRQTEVFEAIWVNSHFTSHSIGHQPEHPNLLVVESNCWQLHVPHFWYSFLKAPQVAYYWIFLWSQIFSWCFVRSLPRIRSFYLPSCIGTWSICDDALTSHWDAPEVWSKKAWFGVTHA